MEVRFLICTIFIYNTMIPDMLHTYYYSKKSFGEEYYIHAGE